jgi:hypothetical protein
MPPLRGAVTRSGRNLRRRVWLFVCFTIFLCILCNLMGPATAVLVIPSLQWLDTPMIGTSTFVKLNSESVPTSEDGSWFWHGSWLLNSTLLCLDAEISGNNYSCTASAYALQLDEWLASYQASSVFSGSTQQSTVTLSLNQTFHASTGKQADAVNQTLSNVLFWAPSRQHVDILSMDQLTIGYSSLGYNNSYIDSQIPSADGAASYAEYDRAVQLILQRKGPVLGAIVTMWADWNQTDHWTTTIQDDKSIKCYNGYDTYWLPLAEGTGQVSNYTKCIRVGSGWPIANKHANFTIAGAYDYVSGTVGPNVTVGIYSSDLAAFFEDQQWPSWLSDDCVINGQVSNPDACDYDRLFLVAENQTFSNRSHNVNTIEFSMSSNDATRSVTLAVDFTAFMNFTTYQ